MAGLYAPLSTLRSHPRGGLRTDRGRRGLLFLHRSGLSPHTPCRSPGALTLAGARVVARHPKRPFFRRWDQGFESSFLQRRGCISREQQVCTRKIPRLRANRIKQHAGEQARLVSACAGVARGGIGRRQRCHFEPDGRLACRAGRSSVAEYGPAHGDHVKGIPLRHLHDAVRADIDVPS